MQAKKINEQIYWVGGIDWDLRSFHGYKTPRGTTYNAYLIIDEKVTLIDTVKHYKFDEMLERIKNVIDPQEIDYIISNHVEMDHSGNIPRLMELVEDVTLFTSPRGKDGLKSHYDTSSWEIKTAQPDKPLNIGQRELHFVLTPMVHWPDNMVTYLPGENILFSNDAFGQHYASNERFDDQLTLSIVLDEAKKYYANIVLPYSKQVQKVLAAVEEMELKIDMIAPSHGIIWRENIDKIIENYSQWSSGQNQGKALIVYDTMWKSTEKIAYALQDMFSSLDIITVMKNLDVNHNSEIMSHILDAEYVCVGSSTLNNNMLPTVASFLTYLKGLASAPKKGVAFGSYGWSGQSVSQVAEMLEDSNIKVLDQIKIKYIPGQQELKENINKLKELI